jgi:site-specific DNA-methyltransferase (adenine-specific)
MKNLVDQHSVNDRPYVAGLPNRNEPEVTVAGRWPANVIHDGSDEVMAGFPVVHGAGTFRRGATSGDFLQSMEVQTKEQTQKAYDAGGSAARFFYTAKASRRDRGKFNNHATVKPFKLIRYLTRLISKRGALVLDPFAGSCTTAVVCEHLRRRWICIELEEAHCEIGVKRIEAERRQLKLF